MINDELIISEYERIKSEGRKIHKLHIKLGKTLPKLVKLLFEANSEELKELDLIEEELLVKLNEHLYKIISIGK